MSRLPPVAKLPLAVRKNVRDEWENKKADYEKEVSDILGESWKIEIDPLQIAAYAPPSSWGAESTGSLISGYVKGAVWQLKRYVEKFGDEGKKEINTVASAHVITMDIDEKNKFDYSGAEVTAAGQLAIVFKISNLGSNIDEAFQQKHLNIALNEAPTAPEGLSYVTRSNIKDDYYSRIEETQTKLNTILQTEITLVPNFEEAAAKLAAANGADTRWQELLGNFVRLYFDALAGYLKFKRFESDEMLREGLLESIPTKKVVFRIIDNGKLKSGASEVVIEDDTLYLQTTTDTWDSNIDQVANNLIDIL